MLKREVIKMNSESYKNTQCFVANELYQWMGHNPMEATKMYKNKDINELTKIYKRCLDLAVIRGYYNQDYENDYHIQEAMNILKIWYNRYIKPLEGRGFKLFKE